MKYSNDLSSMEVDFGMLDCSISGKKSARPPPPPPVGHLRSASVDADFLETRFHRRNKSMDGSSLSFEADSVIDGLKKTMTREKLAELALIDPKKAKRILSNRQSAARSKERRIQYAGELERNVHTLQSQSKSPLYTTHNASETLKEKCSCMAQRESTGLTAENRELKLRLHSLEQQAHLKDALNDTLKEEVQRLRIEASETQSTKLQPSFSGFNTRG